MGGGDIGGMEEEGWDSRWLWLPESESSGDGCGGRDGDNVGKGPGEDSWRVRWRRGGGTEMIGGVKGGKLPGEESWRRRRV